MSTDNKISETSADFLLMLEEYEKTVDEIQEEFLSNVNQLMLSNEITNKTLMESIIQITIIDENKWLDNCDEEKWFRKIFANLSKFVPLFAKTCKEIPAQIELLDGILECFIKNWSSSCSKKDKRVHRIPVLIRCLYDFEILSVSAIMDWYESEISKQNNQMLDQKRQIQEDFMKQIKPFIGWLGSPPDDEEEED